MCDPVIASTAAAVGFAGADEIMKNDQRRKGNKIKQEAADLHRRVFRNKVEGIDAEFRGKQVQASEAKQQRTLEAWKARATSQVGASASGVTGLSVDAVLDDFTRQEGVGNSSIDSSIEKQAQTTNIGVRGLALGTEGALFNLRKENFNPFTAALNIGKAGFRAFSAAGGGTAGAPSAARPVPTNTGKQFGPFL